MRVSAPVQALGTGQWQSCSSLAQAAQLASLGRLAEGGYPPSCPRVAADAFPGGKRLNSSRALAARRGAGTRAVFPLPARLEAAAAEEPPQAAACEQLSVSLARAIHVLCPWWPV